MARPPTGPTDPGEHGEPGSPTEPSEPVDPPYRDDDTQVIGRAAVPDEPEFDPLGFDSEFDQRGFDQRMDEPLADDAGPLPRFDPDELSGLQGDTVGSTAGVRRVLPLEDEASTLVARYLFPTERYRGEWKRHLIHLAWPMVIGIAATFVLGWLSGFLAQWGTWSWVTYVLILIWLGFMGYLAWQVADWHFDRFILTNKRIMKVSGIITRKVAMMPLLRVTDMKYEQTPLGRVLNYGTFVIESAGQDQALREVPYLPNPNELYLRVVEEMYEPAAVEARLGEAAGEDSEEERRAGDS